MRKAQEPQGTYEQTLVFVVQSKGTNEKSIGLIVKSIGTNEKTMFFVYVKKT